MAWLLSPPAPCGPPRGLGGGGAMLRRPDREEFWHVQAQTRANRQGAGFIQSTGEGGPQRPAQGASEFETGAGACTARPSGATLATIMTSTGWQPHTVRGFFAAVVRKKLELTLESEKTDGERVYRIVAGKTSVDAASVPSA